MGRVRLCDHYWRYRPTHSMTGRLPTAAAMALSIVLSKLLHGVGPIDPA